MLNICFLFDYIKHWFQAKNRHGVHSPFVYQLIDEVIYDCRYKADYAEVERSKKIEMGIYLRSNIKKQRSSSSFDSSSIGQLLYRLATQFLPSQIVELGISSGSAVAYIEKGSGEKNDELSSFILINHEYSLLDAQNYLDKHLDELNEKSLIVIDGIYKNKNMKTFWQLIKLHPRVTVTIDLFWIGLIFARPTQAKEHFKIRF